MVPFELYMGILKAMARTDTVLIMKKCFSAKDNISKSLLINVIAG